MGWPGPMTERQLLAWEEWLDHEYAVPSRTDQYIMYAGHLALHANARRIPPYAFAKYRLDFDQKSKRPEPGKPAPISEERRKELYVNYGIRAPRPVTKEDLIQQDKVRVAKTLRPPAPKPPPKKGK